MTRHKMLAQHILFIALAGLWGDIAPQALAAPCAIQCPHIGVDTDCGFLLTITDHGIFVISNSAQGPYDGFEDTLIGVRNLSSDTVQSLMLGSTDPIFAFDGDGICAVSPHPAFCPFGSTGYEGPGIAFTGISADKTNGTIQFLNGLAPGDFAYFGLEEAIQTECPPILGVPLYKQYDSPWGPHTYAHSGSHISALGCHLTCAAMLINYYAAVQHSMLYTTPEELNNWLNTHNGYDQNNNIDYDRVAVYAYDVGGILFDFDTRLLVPNDFIVDTHLCSGNPVILTVLGFCHTPGCVPNPAGHAVLATANISGGVSSTFQINDPGRSATLLTDAPYNNTYSGIRAFSSLVNSRAALVIIAHSPIELLLTDPTGRKTGFDSHTGHTLSEIPGSSYGAEGISSFDASDSGTEEEKSIDIRKPASGHYTLEVIGTGSGQYGLESRAHDVNGGFSISESVGDVVPGEVLIYDIAYSSAPGAQIQVTSLRQRVRVDVEPGICPNEFHLPARGVVKASISGDTLFNVHDIDLRSLRLSRVDGLGAAARPVRGTVTDVIAPFVGAACDCNISNADGISDIVLLFQKQTLITALALGSELDGAIVPLKITGRLMSGIPLEGIDCVTISNH